MPAKNIIVAPCPLVRLPAPAQEIVLRNYAAATFFLAKKLRLCYPIGVNFPVSSARFSPHTFFCWLSYTASYF